MPPPSVADSPTSRHSNVEVHNSTREIRRRIVMSRNLYERNVGTASSQRRNVRVAAAAEPVCADWPAVSL